MASKGKSADANRPETQPPPKGPLKNRGPQTGSNAISSEVKPETTSVNKRKPQRDGR